MASTLHTCAEKEYKIPKIICTINCFCGGRGAVYSEFHCIFFFPLVAGKYKVELQFENVGFWGEGKSLVPGGKSLGAGTRTDNKLNPLIDAEESNLSHVGWGRSGLTTAPSPLPTTYATVCLRIAGGNTSFCWPVWQLIPSRVDATIRLKLSSSDPFMKWNNKS